MRQRQLHLLHLRRSQLLQLLPQHQHLHLRRRLQTQILIQLLSHSRLQRLLQ
jgi:hypothetical protein